MPSDLGKDFLEHSADLLSGRFGDTLTPSAFALRRSISSSYYALFHKINQEAVSLIAPDVTSTINQRIQRWFDHAEMKKICGRFTKQELDQPLRDLLGTTASADLQTVAANFIQLQEARHSADYDAGFEVNATMAHQKFKLAVEAIHALKRLQGTAEVNIFFLSLLMFKNWERDRS